MNLYSIARFISRFWELKIAGNVKLKEHRKGKMLIFVLEINRESEIKRVEIKRAALYFSYSIDDCYISFGVFLNINKV